MRFVKFALGAVALTFVVLASGSASAQSTGFALDRFDPADRGSDWFMLDSLDLRGHLRPALGVVGDWGYKPLVVYDAAGNEKSAIVEHQVFAHLGGSLVLWNRLRGGLSLPLALYQTGDAPTVNGTPFADPGSTVGDLRVSADVRLVGEHGDAFNSAIGFALYLPTGSREQFTGDETTRLSPRVSVAGDIKTFSYAARLGVNYRPLTETFDKNALGTELTIGASAGVRLLDKKLLVGPELYGSTVADSFFEKRTTPLEWLIGGHYAVSDVKLGIGFGSGLTRGWGAPVVRTVLSAEWTPGIDKDSDGDHIVDREDACPTVPGVRTNNPRTSGCPLPVVESRKDRDGDGVADDNDACPDIPGLENVDPAKNGCPPDRDGDKIRDGVDACPDVPGITSDDPAKNGCPPDRDSDGIADSVDACPDVAGVKSEDPKKNGCPADRDGDGVVDSVDACPDTPGPADPDPKKNGCPLARIEAGQVKIVEQVKFKTGSAEILRESDPTLTAVGIILKDHPELVKVRVEGHTDNRGVAAMNKQLSEKRAASVVKWLVAFGIDKRRLYAKGFGLDKPIDSNETDEGRTNNRRVEFHIDPVAPTP
jgi:outer membrane protein OmpA-like peptidoglycan-associated protein